MSQPNPGIYMGSGLKELDWGKKGDCETESWIVTKENRKVAIQNQDLCEPQSSRLYTKCFNHRTSPQPRVTFTIGSKHQFYFLQIQLAKGITSIPPRAPECVVRYKMHAYVVSRSANCFKNAERSINKRSFKVNTSSRSGTHLPTYPRDKGRKITSSRSA